jgi:hypothetical protein
LHTYKSSTHPGHENKGPAARYAFIGASENQDFQLAFGDLAMQFESVQMGSINSGLLMPTLSGSTSASSGPWTATYASGGSAAPGADGYTLTTGTTSNNACLLANVRRFVGGTLNKWVVGKFKALQAAVATSNLLFGVINSQTNPFTTPPTNGVYFSATNGAVVGNVIGASGTLAQTGTLIQLTNGALAELDFKFMNTGSASTSWGEWWVNGVRTPFTSAQVTQLLAITGNLVFEAGVQTTASSAASFTVDACRVEYDR